MPFTPDDSGLLLIWLMPVISPLLKSGVGLAPTEFLLAERFSRLIDDLPSSLLLTISTKNLLNLWFSPGPKSGVVL